MFKTDYRYTNREEKGKYVWLKYQSILSGAKILDVGADQCYLREYLDEKTSYWGIGLGGNPDQQVNLEKEPLPFPNNHFDCVLCLDVLEHLDNIHQAFDELCRVTKQYVILSLPNPYANLWSRLRFGDYRPGISLKFYGLPLEPPEDRHKWFFSWEEAEKFVVYRAAKNKMKVLQIDCESVGGEGGGRRGWLRTIARNYLLRRDLNLKNLYYGTLWSILRKDQ